MVTGYELEGKLREIVGSNVDTGSICSTSALRDSRDQCEGGAIAGGPLINRGSRRILNGVGIGTSANHFVALKTSRLSLSQISDRFEE